MNVLIFGATGLLGSTISRVLDIGFEVFPIVRERNSKLLKYLKKKGNIIHADDIFKIENLEKIFSNYEPQIVINCVSLKNHKLATIKENLSIYSFFPLKLSILCEKYNVKFVNLSTNGVFNGLKGHYKEEDVVNAKDNYGIAKILGEAYTFKSSLVIRTSFIGRGLKSRNGFLNWVLSRNDNCDGFSKAYFSGITVYELASILKKIISSDPFPIGILHIGGKKISKLTLIENICSIYNKTLKINIIDDYKYDLSLDASKFYKLYDYTEKTWDHMLTEQKLFDEE